MLLDLAPRDGRWQMGVDEALLADAREGAPLTLRFYRWQGPWLSLGYAQPPDPDRLVRCAAAGVGVVRRCTGGAAVLHGHDLTYAVVARTEALPDGLAGANAFIAEALGAALHGLGVAVERSAATARLAVATRPFDCFLSPAGDELCAAGRKLVGSAQRREHGALLQHGSIRLAADLARVSEAAGLSLRGATSLGELGFSLTPDRVARAVVDAFTRRLGASPEPFVLDDGTCSRALRRGFDPPARASVEGASSDHPARR